MAGIDDFLDAAPAGPISDVDTFLGPPPAEPDGLTFGESVGRGVDLLQSMTYGAAEALGEAIESPGITEFGREGRERNIQEADQYGRRTRLADIDSAGDFGQWMKETFGEQIPMMAPSVGGAAVGGLGGAAMGGPPGAVIGALIGAFVPSFVLGTGEVQQNIKEKDPDAVAPGSAFIGGSAIAALDTVVPGKVGTMLVRRFGKEAAEDIAKRALLKPGGIVRETGEGMAVEGLTEAVQEAIGEVTASQATGKPIGEDLGEQMVEAGAAGALMGGGVQGGGAVISSIPGRRPSPDAQVATPGPETPATPPDAPAPEKTGLASIDEFLGEVDPDTGISAAAPVVPGQEEETAESPVGPPEVSAGEGAAAEQATPPTVSAAAPPTTAVDEAVAAAPPAPDPSEAQKEAGNYAKTHVSVQGFDVSIETPKGSVRRGVDRDGKAWEVTMPAHYGYIRRTEGADGDQVDVYVGPAEDADTVYVVDQIDPKTGKFDEHKAIMGTTSLGRAIGIYDAAFSDGSGPSRRQAVHALTIPEFREWLRSGQAKKPVSKAVEAATIPPEAATTRNQETVRRTAERLAAAAERVIENADKVNPTLIMDSMNVDRQTAIAILDRLAAAPSSRVQKSRGKRLRYYLPKQAKNQTLTQYLRKAGGLQDENGELAAIGITTRSHPGFVGRQGMTLDDAAYKAWEEGFFPGATERPTPRDLIDALDAEARGQPMYRQGDEPAPERDIEAEAAAAGIDTTGMSGLQAEKAVDEAIAKAVTREQKQELADDIDAEIDSIVREVLANEDTYAQVTEYAGDDIPFPVGKPETSTVAPEGREDTANIPQRADETPESTGPPEARSDAEIDYFEIPEALKRKRTGERVTEPERKIVMPSRDAPAPTRRGNIDAIKTAQLNDAKDAVYVAATEIDIDPSETEIGKYTQSVADREMTAEQAAASIKADRAIRAEIDLRDKHLAGEVSDEEYLAVRSAAEKAKRDEDVSRGEAPPTIERTDQGQQRVIPGAERRAAESKAAVKKAKETTAQEKERVRGQQQKMRKPNQERVENAEGGLFGLGHDDLFDSSAKDQEDAMLQRAVQRRKQVAKDDDIPESGDNIDLPSGPPKYSSAIRRPNSVTRARHEIDLINKDKASPAWWRGRIQRLKIEPETKADIVESGIYDWLKERKGPVTKKQIIDYLDRRDTLMREGRITSAKRTPLNFTSTHTARMNQMEAQRLIDDIRNVARRIAPQVDVHLAGEIFTDRGGLRYRVGGLFDPNWNIIMLALGERAPTTTLRHEVVHYLKANGMFTKAEWDALTKAAERSWLRDFSVVNDPVYRNLDAEGRIEEAIARAYEAWIEGRLQVQPGLRRVFARIREFIERVRNYLQGRGYRSAEDVLRAIERGQIGTRTPGTMSSAQVRLAAAYHGGPHDFDAFSTDFIGTGEGAQAYGWGLYFASKKGVAEYYRNKESGKRRGIFINGKEIETELRNPEILEFSIRSAGDFYKLNDVDARRLARRVALEIGAALRLNVTDINAWLRSEVRTLNEVEKEVVESLNITARPPGRLYTVNLTPAEDEYLLWDKPLSEQSEKVKAALQKQIDADKSRGVQTPAGTAIARGVSLNGRWREGVEGEALYRQLAKDTGSDRAASQLLASLGIPGIKYFDAGSRQPKMADDIRVWKAGYQQGGEEIYDVRGYLKSGGKAFEENMTAKAVREFLGEDIGGRVLSELEGKSPHQKALIDLDKPRNFGPEPTYNYVIFDASHVQIESKLSVVPEGDREILDGMGKKIGRKPSTLKEKFMDFIGDRLAQRLHEGISDDLQGLKLAEMAANQGKLFEDARSAYKLARLSRGIGDVVMGALYDGVPIWQEGTTAIDTSYVPLMQTLEKVGDRVHDFEKYLAARRANDLMAQGKENLFTQEEIDAGLRLADTYPDFEALAQEMYAWNRAFLDFLKRGGLLNDETEALFNEMHANYVPFYRIMEGGEARMPKARMGFAGQHPNFYRITGGEANIESPFLSIERNIHRLLEAAVKNTVMLRAEQINAQTGGLFMRKVPKGVRRALIDNAQMLKDLENQGLQIDVAEADLIDKDALRVLWSLGNKPKGDNIVSLVRGGKVEFYEVTDPMLFRSMTMLHRSQIPFLAPFRAARHMLTAAVGLDPAYQLRNFIRDNLHAAVISHIGYKPFWDATKGMASKIGSDPHWHAFLQSGGGMSSLFESDRPSVHYQIERELRKRGIGDKTKSVLVDSPKALLGMLQRAESTFEYATRVGAFRRLRKQGVGLMEAAYQAREISTDFALKGSFGPVRFLAETVPFLNAGIQGLFRTGRGWQENRLAFLMKGAVLTAATLALYALNRDDERYKELNDYYKDAYWHIWIGDQHFKIPKPFEVGVIFGSLPERMIEAGITKNGDKFLDRFLWMTESMFRIDIIPQLARPPLRVYANKDEFTERPVVPDWLKNMPPEFQYDDRTAYFMRWLGEKTGMSPMKMEALWEGYTAMMGTYALMAVDSIMETTADVPAKPATNWYEKPVIRSFLGPKVPRSTQYLKDFYDLKREVDALHHAQLRLMAEGDAKRLRAFIAENKSKLAVQPVVETMSQNLSRINKAMRIITQSPHLTAREKQERLERLRIARNRIGRSTAGIVRLAEERN